MAKPEVATTLGGRYQLEEQIGVGGMSRVFRARQRSLDRHVAVKMLRLDLVEWGTIRRMFDQEGDVLVDVRHPNVVSVVDRGEHAGTPYLALEYLHGCNLAASLEPGRPAETDWTLELLAPIASALEAIHLRGWVHGDVKPENIMVETRGRASRPCLIDFGLSAAHGDPTPLVSGTPPYLSPERLSGAPTSAPNDIYALGVLAFRCLTGTEPFEGRSAFEVMHRHVSARVPSIAERNPRVDPETARVVERMLSKAPRDRPTSEEVVRWLGQRNAWASLARPMTPARALASEPAAEPLGHPDPLRMGLATLASAPTRIQTADRPLADGRRAVEMRADATTVTARHPRRVRPCPTISAARDQGRSRR